MAEIYYRIEMLMIILIAGLVLKQLQTSIISIEAKQYNQPYGDIMTDEAEDVYPNSFDERDEELRYGYRNGQRMANIYEQQPVTRSGRKRGGREKNQYYNREERKMDKNWPVSASNLELQHDNNTDEQVEETEQHKCSIWVPMDALDKYPDAERKQINKITGSVYIEVCCKGYAAMRWRGQTLCRPVCENCQNGRCIAPNVCECYEEFVANDNGDCVFTCPLGCLNGRCYLDGSCECDPGFKLDESRKFCRPICSKGCGSNRLHNCTEPEVCGCVKGYILTDNDCQPVCQQDCGSGGICRQPDTCECNPGFDLKDGICQADCYQKCDNGICFTRNRCICNPGFTYHERSTQCIPK